MGVGIRCVSRAVFAGIVVGSVISSASISLTLIVLSQSGYVDIHWDRLYARTHEFLFQSPNAEEQQRRLRSLQNQAHSLINRIRAQLTNTQQQLRGGGGAAEVQGEAYVEEEEEQKEGEPPPAPAPSIYPSLSPAASASAFSLSFSALSAQCLRVLNAAQHALGKHLISASGIGFTVGLVWALRR